MAGAKRPLDKPSHDPVPRFFDDEERELIESFEAALERGEVQSNTAEELQQAKVQWKAIVAASEARKAVSLQLQAGDLELIKAIALRRGISYEALITAVLHQFARDATREAT